jgi:hypothetical protein
MARVSESAMTIAEIQVELAQLDAQIAAQPGNYAEALQLR